MSREAANPIVHLELHTQDLDGARAFYADACGWRAERIAAAGRTYVECETPRPLCLPYVEVADISAATQRARELGAAILLESREGPAGWRSVVAAPAGGEIAFWQPKCYKK